LESASTGFDPIVLEVLVIPISILLGIISAWLTKKVVVGPLIYVALTVLFYLWVWVYFYSANSSEFLTIHMNDFDSYTIDIFFIGVTWFFSWAVIAARKKKL
jgi:hypothetical protein